MNKIFFPVAVMVLVAGPVVAATSERLQVTPTPRHAEAGVQVAINWDQIAGNWKQFTGKARQKWGKLTDDDLEVAKGRREELVGKI